MQMKYELNFDEDKIIDIESIGDNGVLDLKDCCNIMNEQQATITKLKRLNDEKGKRIISLIKTNKTLKEENGRLKEINKDKEQDVLHLYKKNEQLKQELQGMDELLKSYRGTIKHDAELLADATRNGYLPPLDDFVKR